MLSAEQKFSYSRDGFLILPNFFSLQECAALRNRMAQMVEETATGNLKSVFTTDRDLHTRDEYFLESGDKIRFFWEPRAFGQFFNKVGHALHHLDSVFKEFSFSQKIQQLVRALGLEDPELIQSMYIFKHPDIGGEVNWHQDATFLYTVPNSIIGLWIALDNATQENGCLWAVPGGHTGKLRSRFVRKPGGGVEFIDHDATPYAIEQKVPLEVAKGSLIVLHSYLPHMSEQNLSTKPRHAYTLHWRDRQSDYPANNWLIPAAGGHCAGTLHEP